MTSPADVSVVIANRNHSAYLPRVIESFLRQRVQPREIVIVDDCSTDESVRIIGGYQRKHPFITLKINTRQLGPNASYNSGFLIATGRYVIPFGADDVARPQFVGTVAQWAGRYPQAGLLTGFGAVRQGERGPVIPNDEGWSPVPAYLCPDAVRQALRYQIPASAVAVRRDALLRAGGYLPQLGPYADWFALLVVAFRHGLVYIPDVLGVHVEHTDSYSARADALTRSRILIRIVRLLVSADYADVFSDFLRSRVLDRHRRLLGCPPIDPETFDHLMETLLPLFFGDVPLWPANTMIIDHRVIKRILALSDALKRHAEDLERDRERLLAERNEFRGRSLPRGWWAKLRWAYGLVRSRVGYAG